MTKTLLKLLLFALLCYVVIEQSYRISAAGLVAFHPVRFNSLNQLVLTDLVELSPYPSVYFQLKPNLDSWFRGIRFRTNSEGLADKEYARVKAPGTFRVAVIGSSWTMATGVPQELAWHAVLEEKLNRLYPDRKFEFINFAAEQYGLREIVGTIEHRALAWEPDLIHVDLTSYTSYMLWQEPNPNQQLPERTNPILQSFSLRALDSFLHTQWITREIPERPTVGLDMELNNAQVLRALREINALTAPRGIPVSVAWLSFSLPGERLDRDIARLCAEYGITYIRAFEVLIGSQKVLRERWVSGADRHPNAVSHALIADRIFQDMQANKLLPGV